MPDRGDSYVPEQFKEKERKLHCTSLFRYSRMVSTKDSFCLHAATISSPSRSGNEFSRLLELESLVPSPQRSVLRGEQNWLVAQGEKTPREGSGAQVFRLRGWVESSSLKGPKGRVNVMSMSQHD